MNDDEEKFVFHALPGPLGDVEAASSGDDVAPSTSSERRVSPSGGSHAAGVLSKAHDRGAPIVIGVPPVRVNSVGTPTHENVPLPTPAVPAVTGDAPSTGTIWMSLNPSFGYAMVVRDGSVDLIRLTGRDPVHRALIAALPDWVACGVVQIRLPTHRVPAPSLLLLPTRGTDKETPLEDF